MDYIFLGNTGLQVSPLCLGCLTFGSDQYEPWVKNEADALDIIKIAIENGINFFDTANCYSSGESESILGKAIKKYSSFNECVIATKVYYPTEQEHKPNNFGLSRKNIQQSVDCSLKRLGTDVIDLYQLHKFDLNVPVEETLLTLDILINQGKIRYIGASTCAMWQLAQYLSIAEQNRWTKMSTVQNLYNLIDRGDERELLPYCKQNKIAVMSWSPLKHGYLARSVQDYESKITTDRSKYHKKRYFEDEEIKEIITKVNNLAKLKNSKPANISLGWLMSQNVTPIFGATTQQHILDAVNSTALTEEEMDLLK